MRLAGHELQREGAPYVKQGRRTFLANPTSWSTSGQGRALCSCGWTSPVLNTGAARKAAHRSHKREMAEVQESGWSVESVSKAMEGLAAGDVRVTQVASGEVQLKMDLPTFLRAVDTMCGLMSCCESMCDAEEELTTLLERSMVADQVETQMKRRKG